MDAKRCPNCNETKSVAEFSFKNRERRLLQSWCRSCERDYKIDWYVRHRQQHIDHVKVQRAATKVANRIRVLAYLVDHPCVGCGETNLVVLDFDHLRDKRWNITYMVSGGFPWSTIETEIAKCQVLCANCHRIKTAKERGYYDQKFRGELFEAPGAYRFVLDNYHGAVSSAG